jgi:hypothetical protein
VSCLFAFFVPPEIAVVNDPSKDQAINNHQDRVFAF